MITITSDRGFIDGFKDVWITFWHMFSHIDSFSLGHICAFISVAVVIVIIAMITGIIMNKRG